MKVSSGISSILNEHAFAKRISRKSQAPSIKFQGTTTLYFLEIWDLGLGIWVFEICKLIQHRYIFCFLSFIFCSDSSAQDTLSSKRFFVTLNTHYGFIVPHNPNMRYLLKKHIPSAELCVIQKTTGEKYWEQLYANPEKGIGIFFSGLGNPQQLGFLTGIFPFVNFPLNPEKRFKLFFRVGDGIGFVTQPYDRISNHKNNIYSSRLNTFISLRLSSVFYPAKKLRMETGIGVSHFSNGAWSTPNKGANILTMNLALGIVPKTQVVSGRGGETIDTSEIHIRKTFPVIIFTGGLNEAGKTDGERYGVFALSAMMMKPVLEKSRFGIGTDLFYNFANLAVAERDTLFDTQNKLNNLQAGARIGYELVIGKLALPVEMGVYLFSKTTWGGMFYHRIGIRYYVNENWILNYSLKTHWATAENIELGVGYKF